MKLRTNKVAQEIANFRDFETHGALSGCNVENLSRYFDGGRLSGEDKDRFISDSNAIRYVVRSYATPIAWYARGEWYKVKQKFSVTTSRHQGQLYLVEGE